MSLLMKSIFFGILLIGLANCYTYKITSESNCLTYDPTYKVCSKWVQSGTIEQDVSCFIGQTIVKEKTKGFIQIKDLEEGDQIATLVDGQQAWSEVEGWLHKSDTFEGTYYNITLSNDQWIGVSGKHNIAFTQESRLFQYGFAIDETEDKKLYPCNKKVTSKTAFKTSGKYAPLTSRSSYLVFTSKAFEPILAHDFASIRNPQAYETTAKAILGVSKVINGGHLLNADGIHIGADWMMDKFSFLLQ